MGLSYAQDDGPRMCWSAANFFQLRWMASESITLDQDSPTHTIDLRGFASDIDSNNSNEFFIVRCPFKGDNDHTSGIFMLFNYAVDYNSGTQEFSDRVTIVEKNSEGEPYLLVAGLVNKGQNYIKLDWNPDVGDLEVMVNDIDMTTGIASVTIDTGVTTEPETTTSTSTTPQATTSTSVGTTEPDPTCLMCGNGEECCEGDGICETKGKKELRACIAPPTTPTTLGVMTESETTTAMTSTSVGTTEPDPTCPICRNGKERCEGNGVCETKGKKELRACIPT